MARMFPAPLPNYVRENPLRSAEIRVYDALSKQLPDSFAVFYSSPWLGTARDGQEIDGEADFVVASPDLGMLVIEVKGGSVSRDGLTGQWRSRDRHGITHRIKNPVEQARQSKHQLLGKLKQSGEWRSRFIRARHGVVLPDSERPASSLGADMPLAIFAFEDDVAHLGEWAKHRMTNEEESESTEQPLGTDGVSALEKLLARSFMLQTPLRNIFAQEDQRILVLTEEQFQILDGLEGQRRYSIAGGAGTGKTVLAVEKAMRMAREGRNTLLTCYNRPLAEYLRQACAGVDHLTVASFHEFCGMMARRAGIRLDRDLEADSAHPTSSEHFYSLTLPEALMDSLALLPRERVDAIVVDEGQDFLDEWWIPLELCLKDDREGVLYVFYDDHQRVTETGSRFPGSIPNAPFRLTRNLRNTRPIFDVSLPFYGGGSARPSGPEGRPIEWIERRPGETLAGTLLRTLEFLTESQNIAREEIAVLCGSSATAKGLQESGGLAQYDVVPADRPQAGAIVIDTARRFKGLERSIVVLLHPGEMLNSPELLYVALTRARLHLIVIGERPELDAVREYGRWGKPLVGS